MNKSNNKKILLFGQGTYLNRGCEAIVKTTALSIKRVNKSNSVRVATFDFYYDRNYHNKIIDKYIKHNIKNELNEQDKLKENELITKNASPAKLEEFYEKNVISEIDLADICFSIGGDNYCYDPPVWLFVLDKEAKERNKKLVLWGASIEKKSLDIEAIKDLRKFDIILARESLTYRNLAKFIDNEKLMLLPDPAFALDSQKTKLPNQFKEFPVIGLNVSPIITNWRGEEYVLASINKLINHVLKKSSCSIALISHVTRDYDNDLEILRKIKSQFQEEPRVFLIDRDDLECGKLKYIISKLKFLIAARTHASIAGYSSQVPTLVLGYSIKSKGIAKDIFGSFKNYVLPLEDISGENLIEKFDFLVENAVSIKKILKEKAPILKKQAENLYAAVIERLEKLDNKNIIKKEKCSGCSACANICPKSAIDMQPDKEGFSFPVVNKKKCIDCKICRQICPNNRSYEYRYAGLQAYGCKNLSERERLKSSSGGIFSLLAKKVLSNKGCIFGAAFENNDVKHIKIENEIDLEKLRGSKYVESTIGNCYLEARKELEKGRKVLFSGTPCQIEGLKNFLGKEYDNLTSVSVVCHGVPSKKVFLNHLEELEKRYGDKFLKINFRNKDKGWKNYQIEYVFEKKSIKKNIWKDNYMIGFLKNYYLRQSCYDCDFRLYKKNMADIILGDFWGIENEDKKLDDDKGVSAVIINSEKGAKDFDSIKEETINKKFEIDQIGKYNPCLLESVLLNKHRFSFFSLFEKMGLNFSVNYFTKNDKIDEVKNELQQIQNRLQQSDNFLQQEKGELQQVQDSLQRSKERIRQTIKRLQKTRTLYQKKEGELLDVINSRKWYIITKLASVFNYIFPHGSSRRKLLIIGYRKSKKIFRKR